MSAEVASPLPDTRPIYQLLRRTRLLLRSTWLLTGLGWTVGLALGVAALVALLDLLVPLPPALRLVGLLLILVPAVGAFLIGLVLPLLRRLGDVHVARRIEQHLPGIHNRLVSCVDLEATGGSRITSSAFYRRLLHEALERIRGFQAWLVLDLLKLRRAGYLAAAGSLIFALAWVAFGDRLPTAFARLASPFADIPPASGVVYEVSPGNAAILKQEPLTISARILSDRQPDALRVELSAGRGSKPLTFPLSPSREGDVWSVMLDSASLGDGYEDGFDYRVIGGGTWSHRYRIDLVERPVIVGVETAVWMPSYMGIDKPRHNPPQTTEVTGPENGEVEVIVRSRGEVATGDVQILKPGKRLIPPAEQTERPWIEDRAPTRATAEGTWDNSRRDGKVGHGTQSHWFQNDPAGIAVEVGDHLFAYVYLPRDTAPKGIYVQWDTGENNWSHGAFWGDDVFIGGKLNSPARRAMGPLPSAGRWVRLEVPAASVGVEGKTLRGLAFKVSDGGCLWGRAGCVRVEEPTLLVDRTFAMKQTGEEWRGRFPLVGQGKFRAELRSSQGHPNTTMKELRFTALPDRQPTVFVEQDRDRVISKPGSPPLTITTHDDYGLAEVSLLFRRDAHADYQKRVLESCAEPKTSVGMSAQLTEARQLSLGGQLRYVIEARDRKGQVGRTREYTVTLSDDPNAADTQLANFEKTQDPFQQRLADLIAQQKKVQEQLGKLDTQNAALLEKVREAEAKAAANPPTPMGPEKKPETPKLDPETAKQLAALQAELARLAQQETQAAQQAQQFSNDLAKSNEQAKNLDMLPKDVLAQMNQAQQLFQQFAAQAMQDLAARMQQGADPKRNAPDLKDLRARGDRLDKELEAMKRRMEALAEARRKTQDDLKKALAELSRKLTEEAGELSARELKELADYIAKLREELAKMQERQADLARRTDGGLDPMRAQQEQANLDRDLGRMLADARNLLDTDRNRRPRKKAPDFPDKPFDPDGKEVKVPPKEEDTDDPLPGQKDKKPDDPKNPGAKKDDKGDKKDMKEEDEPLYQPALGGDRVKPDDRFKNKQRPVPKKPGDKDDPRDAMREQQNQRQQDLQAARQALQSDEKALRQMMDRAQQALQNARGGRPMQGQQGESAMQQLQRMLQSPQMQQAMQMAQRMRQGPPMGQQAQGPRPPTPSPATTGNMTGSPTGKASDAELAKLSPDQRKALLSLPPRVREELLQGMREQGPDGYGPFIQDYFKRLTEK